MSRTMEEITASYAGDMMVSYRIRRMCAPRLGRPAEERDRLTVEQQAIMSEIMAMRTGDQGMRLMEVHSAAARELAGMQQAMGSRSALLPPGPSRRRESGVGPADRGRW